MNPDFGGPQFQIANLIRALGQPFTIVPLSAIATAGLMREQQGDGSVAFNISRNLGGSVGTSLLSTLITQREQFHDVRIGERVTGYITYVQDFLNAEAAENLRRTGDSVAAMQQAYKALQSLVQKSSFVIAFSECFLLIGIVLLIGLLSFYSAVKPKLQVMRLEGIQNQASTIEIRGSRLVSQDFETCHCLSIAGKS